MPGFVDQLALGRAKSCNDSPVLRASVKLLELACNTKLVANIYTAYMR